MFRITAYLTLFTASAVFCSGAGAQLVGHWSFDDNTGTQLTDSSGNSLHGTLVGNPSPEWVPGHTGDAGDYALRFDGSNYVNLGNPAQLAIIGDQTIAMWLYPTDFSERRNPYAKAYAGSGTLTQNISAGSTSSLTYYYGNHGGNGGKGNPDPSIGETGYEQRSISPLTLNAWNFIVVTRDLEPIPGTGRITTYVNGVQRASYTPIFTSPDGPYPVVADDLTAYFARGYVSRYIGSIDDAQIYDVALSAREVGWLMANSRSSVPLWDGSEGTWDTAGSWSIGAVPDLTGPDTARVGAGTVTYSPAGNFIIDNGSELNLSGTGTWRKGAADSVHVGQSAAGAVNQAGGTFDAGLADGVVLGVNAGSTGTYNLNGGTLIVQSIGQGDGTAQFSFGGGTLQAAASFNTPLPMTVNANGATVDTNGYNVGLSGTLSAGTGAGGLVKTGDGTLTLSGDNTFTGPVAINGGVLAVGHQNALGAGAKAVTLADVAGTGLDLGGYDVTIGPLAGGGSEGGDVYLGDHTLTIHDSGTSTNYSGTIFGTGGLIKDGEGTLTLSGPLNYSGETLVEGGMLVLNRSGGSLGAGITGQFTSSGNLITVNDDATLRVNRSYALGDGGQHQVVVNGGTLDFRSGDNYQSDITLTGAAITTRDSGLPWRTGYHGGNAVITVNESDVASTISGRLAFVRTTSGAPGRTTFDVANGAAGHDLVLSAVIVDHPGHENMALVKDGPGTMLLSGDNTFAGAVAIDGGTLVIGHQNALGATPKAVTLADAAGATLALGGFDLAVGSLAGGGELGGEVALGGNTLTVGGLGTSTNYQGIISGTGGLAKTGSGTLTLSGLSDYTGDTIIDAGTLILGKSGSLSTGNTGQFGASGHTVTVQGDATLRLGASWTMGDGGQHHLAADGGTIDFGTSSNYQNRITLTGGAVITSTSGRPWRTGHIGGDALITVNPSDVSSTISGLLTFVRRSGVAETTTFFVADGPAEHDLVMSSVIFDHPPSGSTTYDGMVLVKDGPGTMVLSGASTFSGGVDVNAGTLLVSNTSGSGTGTGPVAVKNGGTLGGTGTIAGATTIEGGGTLATGGSIGKLAFESDLIFEDGAVWDWQYINSTDRNYDQADGPNLILPTEGTIALNIWGMEEHSVGWYDEFTIFTGEVENFDAALFQLENHSDWTHGWRVSLGNSLVLTAVPEPGAWLLLLLALVCGLLLRRRSLEI